MFDPCCQRCGGKVEGAGAVCSQCAAPSPIRVGGYEIQGELGRGGMGVVYRALDPGLNREVALKLLTVRLHERARERFLREGEALARLRHPNVVGVHASGEHDGLPYLVLDLVQGESLAERLEHGPLAEEEAIRISQGLAEALEAVHGLGIVHRDLKPANVLLSEREQPVLTDFGLARLEDGNHPGISVDGAVMGTPGYLAPEQAVGGSAAIGPAADLYGLGATLFAMLCGTPPVSGTLLEVVARTTRGQLDSLADHGVDVDPRLEAICQRCLATDPQDRYPSAGALREALAGLEQAPPLPLALRVIVFAALGVVVFAALIGLFALGLRGEGEDPVSAPLAPVTSDVEVPSPSAQAPASQALDRVLRQSKLTPRARAQRLLVWLRANPAHSRTAEAGRALARVRQRVPVREKNLPGWGKVRAEFLSEERVLAYEREKGLISVWRLALEPWSARLLPLAEWSLGSGVHDLAVFPGGERVLIRQGSRLSEVDLGSGARVERAECRLPPGRVRDMALSPEGERVALTVEDALYLFSYPAWKEEARFEGILNPDEVRFSGDGRLLAVNCETERKGDDRLRVWELASQRPYATHTLSGLNVFLAAGPGGLWASGTRLGQVKVVRGKEVVADLRATESAGVQGERPVFTSVAHNGWLVALCFGPGGRLYSISEGFPGLESSPTAELRVWDLSSGREAWQLIARSDPLYSVSARGRYLILGRAGGFELWATGAGD